MALPRLREPWFGGVSGATVAVLGNVFGQPFEFYNWPRVCVKFDKNYPHHKRKEGINNGYLSQLSFNLCCLQIVRWCPTLGLPSVVLGPLFLPAYGFSPFSWFQLLPCVGFHGWGWVWVLGPSQQTRYWRLMSWFRTWEVRGSHSFTHFLAPPAPAQNPLLFADSHWFIENIFCLV